MSLNILLIEDDHVFQDFITNVLRSSITATVVSVNNNNDAMEYLKTNYTDLIVSDMFHLGIGTGVDLFYKIRNETNTEYIPFIIVSGKARSDKDLELLLYRAGIEGIFPKPFNVEELIMKINRIFHIKTDSDIQLLRLGFETTNLDYKEDIDLSKKDICASVAKDVIAMANVGGGTIILGVAEVEPGKFEWRGVPNERIHSFEPTVVGDVLKKYIGSAIAIKIKRINWEGKTFVIFKVPSCNGNLVLAYCDNESARLYRGRIYVRTNSAQTKEVQDSLELSQIIENIILMRSSKSDVAG